MNIHICSESPCPVQDREIAEAYRIGFQGIFYAQDCPTTEAVIDINTGLPFNYAND